MASLHMDRNAEKWMQFHKITNGLGSWEHFMKVVQNKFGAYEYQHCIDSMLELEQTGTVEEYVTEFEALQFQIVVHNPGMGDTYFVSQFIKGLKSDIRFLVHGQVPQTMERAIMVVKIQQSIQERSKTKSQPGKSFGKSFQATSKDSKSTTFTSHLGKERQMRD